MPTIFFAIIVLAAIGLIALGLMRSTPGQGAIDERLSQFTERTLTLEEMELQQPFKDRILIPMFQKTLEILGKYGPKQSAERLEVSLQQAGNPGNLTPVKFSGLRMALAFGLTALFGFATFGSGMASGEAMMYTAIGTGVGFLLPGIWLGQQIKKRQKEIIKALPDALDLLTVSVEAGLAFDSALQRVTDKWDTELAREFKRVLSDTRLGRPRREALRDMSARTGVDDVQTFVAAIIQAEQLGVSIGKILRIQSDQMRVRRRQRAQEAAQQAPIKMLFPMVFLIFPALFVVILGPAVPRLMGGLGGL
jgi:tight adherence protein C